MFTIPRNPHTHTHTGHMFPHISSITLTILHSSHSLLYLLYQPVVHSQQQRLTDQFCCLLIQPHTKITHRHTHTHRARFNSHPPGAQPASNSVTPTRPQASPTWCTASSSCRSRPSESPHVPRPDSAPRIPPSSRARSDCSWARAPRRPDASDERVLHLGAATGVCVCVRVCVRTCMCV